MTATIKYDGSWNFFRKSSSVITIADPGDEIFEVVLIAESQRDEFAKYVKGKLEGRKEDPFFTVLKAKKLQIYWEGTALHIDDEHLVLDDAADVKIQIQAGLLEFLVAAREKS